MKKIIELTNEQFNSYQLLAPHIVQSAHWAQFLKAQGKHIFYLGEYNEDNLENIYLLYITKIGYSSVQLRIGVLTQCSLLSSELVDYLKILGKREKLLFIKVEPRVLNTSSSYEKMESFGLRKGKDLFLKSTFVLELQKFPTIEELFKQFSTSTRRNIRLAQKKGVSIEKHEYRKGSYENIDIFYAIHTNTTLRKNFSTHTLEYFHKEYDMLEKNMVIFHAKYQDEYIGSIILFIFNGVCYYPYGGTLHKYIDTKSTNLLVYEAITFAYREKLSYFDFWGALSSQTPLPDPLEGVHNFKKGYGGELKEFIGGFDLVLDPILYKVFTSLYSLFWKVKKVQIFQR